MDEKGENVEKQRLLTSTLGLISCFLILLPAVFAWLYVRAFGVSVVFFDAWSMVRLFDRWSSGTLSLSHLFAQHNEHRMFFPKGIELFLGGITNYDNVAEMYLVLACFVVTLIILLLAFRGSIRARLFLFVPISFLIFSFRQHENMLWGFQISAAFAQMFGVLTFFLLYVFGRKRFKKLAFLAALGSGTVASFSFLQGLFVWPAGLLQLFISPVEKKAKKVAIGVWSLVGLGEWVVYFVGYAKPRDTPSFLYVLDHPLVGIGYLLTSLGGSLFWQQSSAFAGGLLLACLALVSLLLIYKKGKLGEYSFWLSLLLYSFLILAAITIGRSGGFGAEQALVSRYASFSILAAVSIYAMLVKLAFEERSRPNTVLLVVLAAILLPSVAISYSKGTEVGSTAKILREKAAFTLYTYESQPDEALTESLNPRPRLVRERAPVLQRLGYNVFSERQAPGTLPPLSNLSPVTSPTPSTIAVAGPGLSQQDGSIIVPEEGPFIKVGGFALDTNNRSTAGGVYVDIDGKLFPAFYGTDRQDVADSLGVPSYRYSGFERAIPVSEIATGTHELSIVVLTADRKGYYQPNQKVGLEVR